MNDATHSRIVSFLWGIADDVLHFIYEPTAYRDVVLPFVVLRRLDAVLEGTKRDVLDMKANLDRAGIVNQDHALRQVAGHSFYNTSPFTLRDLRARASQQALRADFEAYIEGFSPNVVDILKNFEFPLQIPRLSDADRLGGMIEKLLDPTINLSPRPVLNADGSVRHPGLDNHAMGTIFEELLRRFNEQNNAAAGQFWTPRDAVELMARLTFDPVADQLEAGTYLMYDGACGTGGMLTLGERRLHELASERGIEVAAHLYGQEIQKATYAICKADMLLKGDGEQADNIRGPDQSTLVRDAFPDREFDFMLSNPPYGVSWKADLERLGGKDNIRDPRFLIEHDGDPEYKLVTRSNDGQMLFLANMVSKMKRGTRLGSRIAEVHNGSSLFTGEAGQGESNIRRWIIENDWLEAIVALPLNMFYNTGIATYIWLLSNKKPAHREGKVQLIDATAWYRPLRKNLGKKNCELAGADIDRISEAHARFEETEQSKIFPNAAFGYSKVAVLRPLRLRNVSPHIAYSPKELKVQRLHGKDVEVDPEGVPVIARLHKGGKVAADPLRGFFARNIQGKDCVVEYHPDPDLADSEQVPFVDASAGPGRQQNVPAQLDERGLLDAEQKKAGIEAFLRREVLPHAPDAWYVPESMKVGYEVSFTRYFYKPQPLRTLAEIRTDILALEKETEGLLGQIIGGTS